MEEEQTYSIHYSRRARNTNDSSIEESSAIQSSVDPKDIKKSLTCHNSINRLVAVAVVFALVVFAIIAVEVLAAEIKTRKNADAFTCEKTDKGIL